MGKVKSYLMDQENEFERASVELAHRLVAVQIVSELDQKTDFNDLDTVFNDARGLAGLGDPYFSRIVRQIVVLPEHKQDLVYSALRSFFNGASAAGTATTLKSAGLPAIDVHNLLGLSF